MIYEEREKGEEIGEIYLLGSEEYDEDVGVLEKSDDLFLLEIIRKVLHEELLLNCE